jgi:hypothetical protein
MKRPTRAINISREELPTITALLNQAQRERREFKWSGELSRDLDNFVDTVFLCRTKQDG